MIKKTLISAMLFASAGQVAWATPKVVSSIYPLQQIANAIVGEPTDLVADSYLSPHHYSIKPSDAKKVLDADLFIWVNEMIVPQLNSYVERRNEAHKATITASKVAGMNLLKFGEEREVHNHDEHNHTETGHDTHKHDEHSHEEAKHDAHKHDEHSHEEAKHDEYNHDEKAQDIHKHGEHEHEEAHTDDGHGHDHSKMGYNPHVWLSTHNAKVIAAEVAKKLSQLDAENSVTYEKNLQAFIKNVDATKSHISAEMKANPPKPFFLFHNAYSYFENEFGIRHQDVIRAHSGQAPLTKHLVELEKTLKTTPDACLFREPQFKSPIVDQLTANSTVTISVLDPLGYQKDETRIADGYTRILENIATQLTTCGK